MSRRVLPACSSLCYFCPSLRARSRQPVKRYKKIISEIYQLPPDGEPNDRRIGKLCDYVSRNPTRIPKVTLSTSTPFFIENGDTIIVHFQELTLDSSLLGSKKIKCNSASKMKKGGNVFELN